MSDTVYTTPPSICYQKNNRSVAEGYDLTLSPEPYWFSIDLEHGGYFATLDEAEAARDKAISPQQTSLMLASGIQEPVALLPAGPLPEPTPQVIILPAPEGEFECNAESPLMMIGGIPCTITAIIDDKRVMVESKSGKVSAWTIKGLAQGLVDGPTVREVMTAVKELTEPKTEEQEPETVEEKKYIYSDGAVSHGNAVSYEDVSEEEGIIIANLLNNGYEDDWEVLEPLVKQIASQKMYSFSDVVTGKLRRTRGKFECWTARQGPLNVYYAQFRNPRSTLWVPEYCLTTGSIMRLPPSPRHEDHQVTVSRPGRNA